ncbi:TIGR03085 family protein [Streptomyces sp. NP160]|uniref:TIGR03085 family metal-binding protein n=1 Tax=Streptomyces sp. NP160 TaxID=2586637 RepID=UPI00111954A5|nr:TIGR03085 family metal-binding protein [Streptomyces sp. NP160]TNM64564.1 TIGR03085 family protein [Streptomyces sp. NP160]
MTGPDRAHLADLLLQAGPDAPTLCEGWDARELAVHLVVRDGRPDAFVARQLGERLGDRAADRVPALARAASHADAVEGRLRALPFPELVERFRSGPPRWTPQALPPVEALANGLEFYVHGQDVRRAAPDWDPADPASAEELRPGQREALWRGLRGLARLVYRRSPVGVVLVVPAGPQLVAVRRERQVVVAGEVEELVLHATGRRGAAQVEVSGPDDAVAAFSGVVQQM